MIKAIIFDLGGVILKHRFDLIGYILSQMFAISKEQGDKFWSEYRIRLLTGEFSSKQFLQEIKDKTKIEISLDELSKMWKQLYIANAEIDWALLDFVKQLRNRYKVYLLTDTIDIHDEYNKTRKIYEKFDKVFKSHEEKLSKSEGKQIFLNVLGRINVNPYECIFIDDLEEYVKAAESAGIKGIVFKNLPQLKEELRDKKVI